MHPHLQVKSIERDQFLETIIKSIESVNCQKFFLGHLEENQREQRVIVSKFQQAVCESLAVSIPNGQWQMEHCPSSSSRDSIDIFGRNESAVVAIELDKHRADQVAKKFVSRIAILPDTKVYFISLCYPGTENMSKPETIKYFGYCANLSKRMGNVYAGFTIESTT
ncbi:MAG: hypothetical protein Q9M92_14200 [Enterobacterales bacterium]|nr:hypothetical protein [Enterobacterales bacterium]